MIASSLQFGQIGLCDRKAGHPEPPAAQLFQELFTGDSSMKRIPLTQGKFAIVDDEDYDYLMQWKWCANRNGNTYYAQRSCRGKTIQMHRLLINIPRGQQTDHVDGNGLNNQKTNLRACSRAENQHNRRPNKDGTSKYKGVCWNRGRWQMGIWENGKQVNISRHKSEEDAARAYNKKATELFGEFARLNVLPERIV